MPALRNAVFAAVFFCAVAGCSSGTTSDQVERAVQTRVAALESNDDAVQGEHLIHRGAVVRFYKARQGKIAWDEKDGNLIVGSIRGVETDGLFPADYHLKAIEGLVEKRKEGLDAGLAGDLDVLLTDAVAG